MLSGIATRNVGIPVEEAACIPLDMEDVAPGTGKITASSGKTARVDDCGPVQILMKLVESAVDVVVTCRFPFEAGKQSLVLTLKFVKVKDPVALT